MMHLSARLSARLPAPMISGLSLLLCCLALTAQAAPAAYYLPADVAEKSGLFLAASEEMAPRFEAASGKVAQASAAAEQLELGVTMLGSTAPEGMTGWAAQTRRSLVGQSIRLSRFLSKMQEDYSNVFSLAMGRVLPVVGKGYSLRECGNTGIMAQFKQNTCEGEDLNGKIAAALDQDAQLKAALDEIRGLVWPDLVIEKKQWAVVALTGMERTVDLAALAKALFAEQLQARQKGLEAAVAPLEEGIDARDPEAIAKAGALKDAWRLELGVDGVGWQGMLKEALARLEKKGGPVSVGLCGNPALTGGCPGTDVTKQVIELLREDKKFLKATGGI